MNKREAKKRWKIFSTKISGSIFPVENVSHRADEFSLRAIARIGECISSMARLFIIHFLLTCKIATFFACRYFFSTLSAGPPTVLLVINEDLRLVIKSSSQEYEAGSF